MTQQKRRGRPEKTQDEKVIQFCIYPISGHIEKIGREKARKIAENAIKNAIKPK